MRAVFHAVWTGSNPPGMEFCTAKGARDGWTLAGTVVRRFQEGVGGVTYRIEVDQGWKTRKVLVDELLEGVHRSLEVEVRRGRWRVGGRERDDLRGCLDVDLEASPVTNTLPIKRAMPAVGEVLDVKVAWVRFPSLAVATLEQSYENLGGNRYMYRSRTGFRSEIELDNFGLVKKYGDFWEAWGPSIRPS